MDLIETQARFADFAWSVGGDAGALAEALAGPGDQCRRRLEVYAAAVRLKMAGRLRLFFEMTARLMGDEPFVEMVGALARSSPAGGRTAAALARRLPGFLRRGAAARRPDLPDLARLELARAEVADEPDVRPAGWEALARLDRTALPAARLRFVPDLRLLRTAHEVADLWGCLERGGAVPAPRRQGGSVLVWRSGAQVSHAPLEDGDARALSAALRGQTLEGICAAFAGAGASAEAWVPLLRGWFAAGFVAAVR